jgi:predicted phage tail protein
MCSTKTMIKVSLAVGALMLASAMLFPSLRATLFAMAPFALFAICPLSMILGMRMMHSNAPEQTCHNNEPTATPASEQTDKGKF